LISEDEIPMLWEWTSGARPVDENLERLGQAMAIIQRADQVGY